MNRRAAYATSEAGVGQEGLATICEILNLTPPATEKAFQKHNEGLNTATKTVSEKKLSEAAREYRQQYMKDNPELQEDSVIDVTASFDGI